jgi:uncharacterized iron-regulated membrane protein
MTHFLQTIRGWFNRPVGKTPLYVAVWRWHFYAGIFVIPFMVLLSITGGIYLFKTEIEQYLYKDLLTVQPLTEGPIAEEKLMAHVKAAFPKGRVLSYTPPANPNQSVRMSVLLVSGKAGESKMPAIPAMDGEEGKGGPIDVFVNPYTGQVLGSQAAKDRIMQTVRNLHGKLLIGTQGEYLIELAAGWAFVLLVSGLYLWFPRGKELSVWGTLLPRLRAPGRTFWVDLHAVPSLYLTAGILFLIVTGLPWTLVSGGFIKQFSDSGREGPSIARADLFKSMPPGTEACSATEWLSILNSNARPSLRSQVSRAEKIKLAEVTRIADSQGLARPYQIAFPKGPTGVYSVRTLPQDPRLSAFLHLDQYNGKVLGLIRFEQMKVVGQAVSVGIATHEGRMFGPLNQAIGVVLCLGILLIAYSAVVMWWKRRPAGRLGAPAAKHAIEMPKGIVALTALLGVFFPPVGVSVVLVFLIDRFLLPRLPKLKWVLG